MKRRVPFIEQHQKTECGLCCVAMVSSYFDHEISVKALRNIQETGRDGTNFGNLIDILENIGFSIKSFRYPKEQVENFSKILTPAIALWQSKHFVVIEKANEKFVWIVDPELGRIRYSLEEFSEGFSEYLISIVDSSQVSSRKSKENFQVVYKQLLKTWSYFIPLLFLTLGSYGVNFIFPLWMQQILNEVSQGVFIKQFDLLLRFLGFVSIYFIIMLCQRYFAIILTSTIDEGLNNSVISNLFKLPYKFFSTRSSGDLIYSINGLSRIRQLFTNQFILGILDIGFAICILIYFARFNYIISLLAILLLFLNLSILFLTKQSLEQRNKSFIISQNDLQNKQIEMVYSMMGIKMEGFEDQTYKQWKSLFDKNIYRYKCSEIFSGFVNSLFTIITFISPFVLLFVSLQSNSSVGIGSVFALYSLSTLLFSKTNNIFETVVSFYNSKTFLARIVEILEEDMEENGQLKFDLKGDIELRNVSFSYTKDSKKVLENISLEIKQGEQVAIVGSSGSGKSTLSKLLIGLYPASSGKILFDNIDYDEFEKKYLRQQIGIVPQDMTLFNKTILENIIGDNIISQEEVEEICKLVNIHDEIQNMPMGYHTIVSEMGLNLSGGQRQRIILARALVKKPRIMLLDEATSYLDNVNEKQIMRKFKEQNITIILIAHRLSIIIDSDQIFVMDNGKISERGTHRELLNNRDGLYSQLYQMNY
ncbi:peptidase domain-containing ABC transporter [Streptococcus suis]|uniref:peptidase domain-containing ABC transporter n=1 Tax=Streptococcus suis TaxID=1307 RepID=UPI0030102CFD